MLFIVKEDVIDVIESFLDYFVFKVILFLEMMFLYLLM